MESLLRKERLKANLSIRGLAKAIKTSPSEILRLENYSRAGELYTWVKIWNYFKWDVDYFVEIIMLQVEIVKLKGGNENENKK